MGTPACQPSHLPTLGSITKSFYRSAAGVLLVFDLTNRASFEHVPEWYHEAAGDQLPAFVLVGHKCDLEDERAVSAEEAGHLAATLGMAFVETSAHSNLNVELAFQTLAGGIQQALGQGILAPHQGCDGIRLIPSQSQRQPLAGRKPHKHCQSWQAAEAPMEPRWQYQFRVIMLGDSTVGKSSLLRRYTEGAFLDTVNQTVGVDFYVQFVELEPGLQVKLQFWDTAGQERFRWVHGMLTVAIYQALQTGRLVATEAWDGVKSSIPLPVLPKAQAQEKEKQKRCSC
ncbi:hypothetical protein EK904_014841 [Melospiza melodia maxima]|nr:hypothetical protein EK904_014841 [Melospiza melodia maxima]